MNIKEDPKNRYPLIDVLRGLAIVGMIIFHFVYDLSPRGLNFIATNVREYPWRQFQYSIGITFLFCVGISLSLSHGKKIRWNTFFKRLSLLACCAIIISIVTYITIPSKWIYFGILHCITISSLIGILFVRIPKVAFFLGLFIIVLYYSLLYCYNYPLPWINSFIKKPSSLDYYSIFPWFGYVLIGIGSVIFPWYKIQLHFFETKFFKLLKFLSTNSLKIYIIHQPILYGTLILVKLVLS